ncbi:MAG: hypothetical protein DI547_03350, partial [Sphingobium sp.]
LRAWPSALGCRVALTRSGNQRSIEDLPGHGDVTLSDEQAASIVDTALSLERLDSVADLTGLTRTDHD